MTTPQPEPPPPIEPFETSENESQNSQAKRRSRSPNPKNTSPPAKHQARRILRRSSPIETQENCSDSIVASQETLVPDNLVPDNLGPDESGEFCFGSKQSSSQATPRMAGKFRRVGQGLSNPSARNSNSAHASKPAVSSPMRNLQENPHAFPMATNAFSWSAPQATSNDQSNSPNSDLNIANNAPISYANMVSNSGKKKRVALDYFPPNITSNGDIAPVELPMALCEEGSKPYVNTLYGYFIGTKMAFPFMNDHLQKRWAKYGVGDISRNGRGFYFIQFNNEQGLLEVLEGGPWMISNVPFFIQRWYPGVNLSRENHDSVPVWVKIHDVPLEAWSMEGISRIASNIGKPLDMDSYTEHKCNEKLGRSAYARVLVEMNAEREWKSTVEVKTWNFVTKQSILQALEVEYGWIPQRCSHCKIYGHLLSSCPRVEKPKDANAAPIVTPNEPLVDSEGFTRVNRNQRKKNRNQNNRGRSVGPKNQNLQGGFPKHQTKQVYVAKNDPPRDNSLVSAKSVFERIVNDMHPKDNPHEAHNIASTSAPGSVSNPIPISTSNRFASLNTNKDGSCTNMEDDDEIIEIIDTHQVEVENLSKEAEAINAKYQSMNVDNVDNSGNGSASATTPTVSQ